LIIDPLIKLPFTDALIVGRLTAGVCPDGTVIITIDEALVKLTINDSSTEACVSVFVKV
jgi:hypothetical protein